MKDVFNDSYNLPANSGIARILHLDPDRHVSTLYKAAKQPRLVENGQGPVARRVKFGLRVGMALSRATTSGVSEAP